MTSWVSEPCIKSIILALLNLFEKELQGPLAAVGFFPLSNILYSDPPLYLVHQTYHKGNAQSRSQPQQNMAGPFHPSRHFLHFISFSFRLQPPPIFSPRFPIPNSSLYIHIPRSLPSSSKSRHPHHPNYAPQ